MSRIDWENHKIAVFCQIAVFAGIGIVIVLGWLGWLLATKTSWGQYVLYGIGATAFVVLLHTLFYSIVTSED